MSDSEDDFAILNDALKGVSVNDLEFVIEHFERKPKESRSHTTGEHVPASTEEHNVEDSTNISTDLAVSSADGEDKTLDSLCARRTVDPQVASESSDEYEDVVESPSQFDSPRPPTRDQKATCNGCSRPGLFVRHFGVTLCHGCTKMMRRIAKGEVNLSCPGDGNCRTTYKLGSPMRCNSCRARALSKLNIKAEFWLQFKRARQSVLERVHDRVVLDKRPPFASSSCEICGGRHFVVRTIWSRMCCRTCRSFLYRTSKMNFKITCATGEFRCEVKYTGVCSKDQRMCPRCRLDKAISLGFTHPKLKTRSKANVTSAENPCPICEHAEGSIMRDFGGIICCENCRQFLKRHSDYGIHFSECITGQYDCKPGKAMCSGCRLKRADSLGYEPSFEIKPVKLERPQTDDYEPDSDRPREGKDKSGDDYTGVRRPRACKLHQFERSHVRTPRKPAGRRVRVPKEPLNGTETCEVCARRKNLSRIPSGGVFCHSCMVFLRYSSTRPDFPFACITGRYDCDIMFELHMCRACRVKKALYLGYKFQSLETQSRAALGSGLKQEPNVETELPGGSLEESASDEITTRVHPEDDLTDESSRDINFDSISRPETDLSIQTATAETRTSMYSPEQFGPTLDMSRGFHRWLYGNMDDFKVGSGSPKTPQDEVGPSRSLGVITFCDDISEQKVPLLTQDLNPNDRPLLEEISVPKMHIRPSSSLLRAAKNGKVDVLDSAKPKITLTLETQHMTIDRRPLIKKVRISVDHERNSESLIGPGEDCDEGEEVREIELD